MMALERRPLTSTIDARLALLGGAKRGRTRPRGFAPWTPQAETEVLLDQVRAVFDEYVDYLPLTIRQIFYRLVGRYEYEKTEQAYTNLSSHLNRARRARLIPMENIRDDSGTVIEPNLWDSGKQFLEAVRTQAGRLMLDRTAGQKTRLVVFCEAEGMTPQLASITKPYGILARGAGGFESTTFRYKFASELTDYDCPTEVLDIGDHDPSGAHKYIAFCEDVEAFVRELGGRVSFTRLAVTPQQIETYQLPTAPPKAEDKRAFRGPTCQVEAFAPDVLADILRNAIEARLDRPAYERVLKRERAVQRELTSKLRKIL
jgi:hypothetical protein